MTDVDSDVLDGDVTARDALARIRAGEVSLVVRSGRPDEIALELVDALDADFVDTVDGMAEVIASRVEAARASAARVAAEAVAESRAEVHAAEAVVAELAAVRSVPSEPPPPVHAGDPDDEAGPQGVVRRSAPVVAVAAAVGVAGLAAGAPVALLAPVLALVWVAVLVRRHREDLADRSVAAAHLVAVAAYTDRAYGRVELHESEELAIARRHLAAARTRLRDVEAAWAALDGTVVDAEVAPERSAPLVVLDEDGAISDETFAGWTTGLTADVQVVLVSGETS